MIVYNNWTMSVLTSQEHAAGRITTVLQPAPERSSALELEQRLVRSAHDSRPHELQTTCVLCPKGVDPCNRDFSKSQNILPCL